MTVDISRKFVKSVIAETHRNPPAIKLQGSQADTRIQILAGAVRYIEDRTGALNAYAWAKECAAVGGLGWIKVCYREDDQSDVPAVIDIDRVDDPLSIKMDPDAIQIDGSDMMYLIEEHGDDRYTYWLRDGNITRWYIISDQKIEDKGTWPAPSIPYAPVFGEILRIRNKTRLFGIIRQISDNQRAYNYTWSEIVERMALSPKSPTRAAEGSISSQYMRDWRQAATKPVPILFYNTTDREGNPLPPPEVGGSTAPDIAWGPAMLAQIQQTANETTGISPEAYGASSDSSASFGQQSGIAVEKKQEASDRGHLVYDTHLQAAVRQVGELVLSLFEPIITPTGKIGIMMENGDKMVLPVGGPPTVQQTPQGPQLVPPLLQDLKVGDLQVSVSSAPAFSVRKQQGIETITTLMGTMAPEQTQKIMPEVIKDLGFPGAERYATILSGNDSEGAVDPMALQQAQAQVQEAQAQAAQMQAQIQALQTELKTLSQATLQKAMMDSETKKALKQMDIEANLQMKIMELTHKTQENDKSILSDQATSAQKTQTELSKVATNANIALTKISAEQEEDSRKLQMEAAKLMQTSMQPPPSTLSSEQMM